MAIRSSKQNWQVGSTVKVGFLSLQVLELIPTPGDHRPDAYVLASGKSFYRFVPHYGLERRTSLEDARLS